MATQELGGGGMSLRRLDRYGTGDNFRKPRHGMCGLCHRPVIEHPTFRHRWYALLELTGPAQAYF